MQSQPGILKASRAGDSQKERDERLRRSNVQFSREIRDLTLSSQEEADFRKASLDQLQDASNKYLENQQQIELRHLARLSEVKQTQIEALRTKIAQYQERTALLDAQARVSGNSLASVMVSVMLGSALAIVGYIIKNWYF